LEGILSILSLPQNPVTHPKHKWPVTINKLPECRLAPAEVRGEQLSIGFAGAIRDQTGQATEAQIHPLPQILNAEQQLPILLLPPRWGARPQERVFSVQFSVLRERIRCSVSSLNTEN
jgi:hypothetical protein